MHVRYLLIVGLSLSVPGMFSCLADESNSTRTSEAAPLAEASWKFEFGDADASTTVTGRIVSEISGSAVLLEERNGKLHQISAKAIRQREELSEPFNPYTSEELAADLLHQVPSGFEVTETEHYLICSNSAAEYVDYTAKLLELVFDQYFRFAKDLKLSVTVPSTRLPVIIFASPSEFQAFAARQHPSVSFEDTPGYFSVTNNQTMLLDLTGDRSIRSAASIRKRLAEKQLQVATVVHEAVHQLAFNTGLQVRMADNPLWISEGLAMYFETTSTRSSMLWNRPGLVNPRHHPGFLQIVQADHVIDGLNGLIAADSAFLSSTEMAAAYAKAWALTHFLIRQERGGIQLYFESIAKRKPMVGLTESERIEEFREAFGKMPDELERELVSFIKRQRVSR